MAGRRHSEARWVRTAAPAKINLGLKILGRRPDGFHELRTVFQTLALHDTVEVAFAGGGEVALELLPPVKPAGAAHELFAAPLGGQNLVVRAAQLAQAAWGLRQGIRIRLRKRIPMRAGLGGGSSDAAAVLKLVAARAGRPLPPGRLFQLAAELGSDVPAFLIGGTVLGIGRGEEVYPLPPLDRRWCVIAMPAAPEGVDTAAAFRRWDAHAGLTGADASATISTFCSLVYQALPAFRSQRNRSATGKAQSFSQALKVQAGLENDFEEVVFPLSPDFPRIQRQLWRSGARWVSLAGSGAAQFGLFADRASATRAANDLGPRVLAWVTRFAPRPTPRG